MFRKIKFRFIESSESYTHWLLSKSCSRGRISEIPLYNLSIRFLLLLSVYTHVSLLISVDESSFEPTIITPFAHSIHRVCDCSQFSWAIWADKTFTKNEHNYFSFPDSECAHGAKLSFRRCRWLSSSRVFWYLRLWAPHIMNTLHANQYDTVIGNWKRILWRLTTSGSFKIIRSFRKRCYFYNASETSFLRNARWTRERAASVETHIDFSPILSACLCDCKTYFSPLTDLRCIWLPNFWLGQCFTS